MRIWKRYIIFALFMLAGHCFLESDKWIIGSTMYKQAFDFGIVSLIVGCALWYTWHESDILPEDPEEGWKVLEAKWKKEKAERRWSYTLFPSACLFAYAIMYDLAEHNSFSFSGFCVLAFYACIFIQLMLREPNRLLK